MVERRLTNFDLHRKARADLDPDNAATDRMIAMVRSHRQGEDDPRRCTAWQSAGSVVGLL